MTGQALAMVSHPETRPDAARDAASPFIPPRIAFAEAAHPNERFLKIQRVGDRPPVLAPSPERPWGTPAPRLAPWFDRLSRALKPFDDLAIDIEVDKGQASQAGARSGDPESALRLFAIEAALELARGHGSAMAAAVTFSMVFAPAEIETFMFVSRSDDRTSRHISSRLPDIAPPLQDWLIGVRSFGFGGKLSLPSAHERLELERSRDALLRA